jgi:hypothetical protein
MAVIYCDPEWTCEHYSVLKHWGDECNIISVYGQPQATLFCVCVFIV